MEFNSQLENVLSEEGEKAFSYMWLHTESQKKYNMYSNFINIPVIVLSTLAGASSIGSDSLFRGFEQASVIIGLVSILVGILSTLQQYFNFERRTEAHRISAIQYYKCFNFIKIELSLPRNQRTAVSDFIKLLREDLERLKEISPAIPDNVLAKYKQRFNIPEYAEVCKPPEANGLTPIIPFSVEIEMSKTPVPSPRMSVVAEPKVEGHDIPPLDIGAHTIIVDGKPKTVLDLVSVNPPKRKPFK